MCWVTTFLWSQKCERRWVVKVRHTLKSVFNLEPPEVLCVLMALGLMRTVG